MKVSYLGHACLYIETQDKNIIVDPFITGNPLAKDIDIDNLDVDYILLTHGHIDHVLDVDVIAQRTGAKIISNFEIVSYYEKKGFEGHPMNHGGAFNFDFGKLKFVNAVHSSVLPDGTYGGNAGGFVLQNEDACIYIAGDTALTMDMKLIPMQFPNLDLVVLPIGDNFTMGVEDAIIASDFVECNIILGYHFDTFPPIKLDHQAAQDLFEEDGKQLLLLNVGETLEF